MANIGERNSPWDDFSAEEQASMKARGLQRLHDLIDEHERRMRTDPAYVREHRKKMRQHNMYMFFHDCWTFKHTLSAPFGWLKKKFQKENSGLLN